ncbi:extracellular solute-binding protein [Bdellovibrio bacteriovorus]|uniref:Putative iron ABC transporter n=1 Tax=Bdellovibrio bacteriovorus str. Tiberius TaxID=1069642 RepID=K7YYQ2_BDEBC|nr:extracellular solute-binding protein [Bdellovibrio bacteriovorus]AFY02848.1 putative iron ABC transporter [Bdellovibrio bacteriovorus str. Tiberius]
MSSKMMLYAGLLLATVFQSVPAVAADKVTKEEIVVYSARKEELIKPIFDQFTKETGIAVKFLSDDAPKLIARLESEGASSPADILITVDVANLTIAKDKGLFAPVKSTVLEKNVPAIYRDKDNQWFALSKRVRAIFYNKEKVKPEELSTYEDLASPRWKGEILTRSSSHPYNQSLLANIVSVHGVKDAQKWADGFVANLARPPQGGDSDQLKAVAAGEAKLAVANSYYFGRMMVSELPEDKLVAQKVGIFFPNQKAGKGDLTGAHVNISGGGLLKSSKNTKNAQKLLEFLTADHAQNIYAAANKEFPVNPAVKADAVLAAWGPYKNEGTNLSVWANHSKDATRIADKAGWK